MQLFNRVKSIRVGGKAKVKTKHAPSNVENACQIDALLAAASQGGSQVDSISIASERWEEFCRKYEQRPKNLQTNLVPSGSTSTIRTTYLDNLLYHTAKLHEHHWTLLCQHEKYKGLCTPQQWDAIRHDLELYSKAIQSLELWLQCSNTHPCLDQIDSPGQEQQPCIQGLPPREGISISQLQKTEDQMLLPEDHSREQGGVKGWTSKVAATIVMMMGSRAITPPMTKGFIALAVVIATTAYAMHLLLVAGLWWANGCE